MTRNSKNLPTLRKCVLALRFFHTEGHSLNAMTCQAPGIYIFAALIKLLADFCTAAIP